MQSFWCSSHKSTRLPNTCATGISLTLCPSLFLCFISLSLPVCTSAQESQQRPADFSVYIENHTRNPDDLSRKQVRIYQLYSRTTGKHVQILGKKINANGDDGGQYGMGEFLCISPDTLVHFFEDRVRKLLPLWPLLAVYRPLFRGGFRAPVFSFWATWTGTFQSRQLLVRVVGDTLWNYLWMGVYCCILGIQSKSIFTWIGGEVSFWHCTS